MFSCSFQAAVTLEKGMTEAGENRIQMVFYGFTIYITYLSFHAFLHIEDRAITPLGKRLVKGSLLFSRCETLRLW